MRRQVLMLVLAGAVATLMAACADDDAPIDPSGPDLDDIVIANAATVRAAADAFAVENGGVYACNLASSTLSGKSMIDFLPDGSLLVNPFHLAATEPLNGAAAGPGQIGYVAVTRQSSCDGYVITAWGLREEIATIKSP